MFYVFLTVLFWGLTPVLDKISALQTDAVVGVFIRTACIGVLITLIMTFSGKWGLLASVTPRTAMYLGVSGILAGCLGVFTFLRAMQVVKDAGKVAVLSSTYPLVALALTAFFLHEKITTAKIAGSVLITAGVVLLNL